MRSYNYNVNIAPGFAIISDHSVHQGLWEV